MAMLADSLPEYETHAQGAVMALLADRHRRRDSGAKRRPRRALLPLTGVRPTWHCSSAMTQASHIPGHDELLVKFVGAVAEDEK
jgi:hypothetical protein